jgi:hypothetical protein
MVEAMWDALITAGNLVIVPALLPTLLNRRAYVPRVTSGMTVLGIVLAIAGLFGAGLLLSPLVLAAVACLWLFIFVFRGRPFGEDAASLLSTDAEL